MRWRGMIIMDAWLANCLIIDTIIFFLLNAFLVQDIRHALARCKYKEGLAFMTIFICLNIAIPIPVLMYLAQ